MGQFAQVVWFEEHFQVVVMDGIAGDVQRFELVPWFALNIIQQWRVLYPVWLKVQLLNVAAHSDDFLITTQIDDSDRWMLQILEYFVVFSNRTVS